MKVIDKFMIDSIFLDGWYCWLRYDGLLIFGITWKQDKHANGGLLRVYDCKIETEEML